MTNTELLNFIRIELKKQGLIWKTEKELFTLLLPHEKWKDYKSKWSSWRKKRDGSYGVEYLRKSSHILSIVAKRLHFDISIWDMANEAIQKESVRKGIICAFKPTKELLDLDKLLPNYELLLEQVELLDKVSDLSLEESIEALHAYEHWFKPLMKNQPFLLELINKLYVKGAFEFLVDNVFPNLITSKREKENVKIIEAHCLSSLPEPKYLQTVELLNSIKTSNSKELIDLRTSAISNFRRHHITHSNLDFEALKEGITMMIETYHNIYSYKGLHHYYPALHLLYTLVLGKALGLEEANMNLDEVYVKAEKTLKEDIDLNSNNSYYYAKMSDFEMQVLLGKANVVKQIEHFLANTQPNSSLIFRTKRQMIEYVELIERLELDLPTLVAEFTKVVALFEDYEKM